MTSVDRGYQGDGSAPPAPALTMRKAHQLELVHQVVAAGMTVAAAQLSRFVGQPLQIEAPRLGLCPVEQLVETALGSAFDLADWSAAEALTTGIYLSMSGDVTGHFLLLLAPADARALVAPLVSELAPDDAQRESLMLSALSEVGNITASSLLNALADAAHLRITASCPAIVTDMAGAILEWPVLDLIQSVDQAIFIETRIRIGAYATVGSLALIPRPDGLEALITGLSQRRAR